MKNLLSERSRQYPYLSLQSEINKAIKDFYEFLEPQSTYSSEVDKLIINPSMDIVEDEKFFKVEVEMPGIAENDINVTINDNILSVQGIKKTSKKDEGKNYMSREIGYGRYERNILLPDYVETNNAKATFKKGMLWITFPKQEKTTTSQKVLKIEKA